MTCKDCKNRRKCTDRNKSYQVGEDGDSWANWCDDFLSIHKTRKVKHHGVIAVQVGYNWHIHLHDAKTGQFMGHMSCTKKHSKRGLKSDIDLFLKLRNRAFEKLHDGEDEE